MYWKLLVILIPAISLSLGIEIERRHAEYIGKYFNRVSSIVHGSGHAKCPVEHEVKHSGSVVSNGYECAAIGG